MTTHVEKASLYSGSVHAMAEYLVDMGQDEPHRPGGPAVFPAVIARFPGPIPHRGSSASRFKRKEGI